ncbi:MAG: radical SAM protein [Myxococcaceae bacterium]
MNLKSLALEEWQAELAPLAASPTAVRKLFAAVFAHGAEDVAALRKVPQVPARVRDHLLVHGRLPALQVLERRRAADGFVKYLFGSSLGGRFEAVRIPLFEEKYVVCVSSQVGCALACDFCATGQLGFLRNLETWEMVDQVLRIRAEADRPVRGVVFMGMGEPLLNPMEVLRAARILSHPAGLAISARAISLSTAGVVPAIHRYVREGHPYRLVFSLTSAIAEKRRRVMPIEATHCLPELVEAISAYARVRRERAMLAYVLIAGFNTGREDAQALADTFRGVPIKLDLIDVTDPTGRYQPPGAEELARFRDYLQVVKAPIARRYSGGKEIQAACGTLAGTSVGGKVLPLELLQGARALR